MNPLLKRLSKNDHGQKAEKRAAKRINGSLQPGSGNQDHSKADIRRTDFLVESKSTINDSLSLQRAWLHKVSDEAIAVSLEPALMVQFVDGQGRPRPDGSWVMISERVFKEHFGV